MCSETGLELLSVAWGLPLSELKRAITNDEDDDNRLCCEMGGRESENAGVDAHGPNGGFVERD